MNLEPQARAKPTDPLLVTWKVKNVLKICTKSRCSVCCCPHTNTQSHTYYGGESTENFHLWHRHRTWSSSLMLLMLSFPAKVARFLRRILHPTTQLPTARCLPWGILSDCLTWFSRLQIPLSAHGPPQPAKFPVQHFYRLPSRRTDNLATFMCRLPRNSGSLNLLE